MTDSARLERRYRRLIAFYPKAFRREHADEMLSVLMAAAAEGRRRPRWSETGNLLGHAIVLRLRRVKIPSSWEYRHAGLMIPVRLISGLWLLCLTAILYGYGRGGWWAALLVPSAALHFYLVYRLTHAGESRPPG